MASFYTRTLLQAILKIIRCRVSVKNRRLILLIAALSRLESKLKPCGLSIRGRYLSVDSAYAPGYIAEYSAKTGLKLVSEVRNILCSKLLAQI